MIKTHIPFVPDEDSNWTADIIADRLNSPSGTLSVKFFRGSATRRFSPPPGTEIEIDDDYAVLWHWDNDPTALRWLKQHAKQRAAKARYKAKHGKT